MEHEILLTKELNVARHFVVAGRTGRPAYFHALVNAKMGGWFNASKSYVDLQAVGGVTGLLSAHCMELKLPSTVDTGGHLTVAEHELVCADSTTVNGNISFAWFQVSGDATAKTDFNLKGAFFEVVGMEVGNGNIFSNGSPSAFTHALRIRVDDVNYYIPLAASFNAS